MADIGFFGTCGSCGGALPSPSSPAHQCWNPPVAGTTTAAAPTFVVNPPPTDLHAECRAREQRHVGDRALWSGERAELMRKIERMEEALTEIPRCEAAEAWRLELREAQKRIAAIVELVQKFDGIRASVNVHDLCRQIERLAKAEDER